MIPTILPSRKFAILLLLPIVLFAACGLLDSEDAAFSEVRTAVSPKGNIGEPFGLALSGSDLYVSDGAKGIIWKFDSYGVLSEFANGLDTPSHIAFADDGLLYVADSGDHTIKTVDSGGVVSVVAGSKGIGGLKDGPAGEAMFNSPVGIAAAAGRIYIADTYNDRVRILEDGKVSTFVGSTTGLRDSKNRGSVLFNTPTGLAFAGETLLVADTGNKRIRAVEKNGATATLAGSGGKHADGMLGEAHFVMPVGLAVDKKGTIYVADGDRIRAIGRRFLPIVETIGGDTRGFADGALKRSRFNRTSGLAIASNGDLFVTDSDNGLVRVLTGNSTGEFLAQIEFRGSRPNADAFRAASEGRWPYDPPKNPREIAGTMGEIRGEIVDKSSRVWFHNGLDMVGGYGEEARTIRAEKILRPVSIDSFATGRENIRFPTVGYIHIRFGRTAAGEQFDDERFHFWKDKNNKLKGLRVPRGASFKQGEVIGTLNSMNHVHLIAGPAGGEMNALDALSLPGVSDSRIPVIEEILLFDMNWRAFETENEKGRIKVQGNARIVARAYDQMDGNEERRRLGLYKLGYQLLDPEGMPLKGFEETRWTIVFNLTPPDEAVRLVYAKGSRSGATGRTEFNYIVSNSVSGNRMSEGFLELKDLPEGDYNLRVFAADFFGNTASKEIEISTKH